MNNKKNSTFRRLTWDASRIRRVRALVLTMLLAATAAARHCDAQVAAGDRVPPREGFESVAQRVADAMRWELEDKQIPSLAIALVDDRGVIWADAFGFADLDKTRPATIHSLYRVGSVSKLFTDISAMQLVEAGLLDLDAAVIRYLPEFAVSGAATDAMTVRQLMCHRAGLVRESPVGHYFDPTEPSLDATIASLNRTAVVYPPGQRTKYSNAGVSVVGLIVERIVASQGNARAYAEIINDRILRPLQMSNSCLTLDDAKRPLAVESLMWAHDGRTFVAPQFALGTLPAGNLYSSVADMANFLEALIHWGERGEARVLQADTLREMYRQQYASEPGPERDFGLGFALSQWEGRRRVGHGGAVYGCATEVAVLPDDRLAVIVVAARDCANSVVRRLAGFALQSALAMRDEAPLPTYQRSVPMGRQRAAQVAGSYRRSDGNSDSEYADLFARGEELVLDHGGTRGRLRIAGDAWLVDDVLLHGKKVEFGDNDHLMIDGVAYQRLAEECPDAMPQRFAGLVGEYGWDHNVLFIYEKHGRLHALIEWFFDYPLREIDADTYAFPDFGLYHGEQLRFHRNENGFSTDVVAAEVKFERRSGMSGSSGVFQIQPLHPIDALRQEALAAEPPEEHGDLRIPELVELKALDPTIQLDIRYASKENFLGVPVYEEARAFMQRPAAEALVRVQQRLRERGYGLRVFDAYRPWYVTKIFYDATPGEMKHFVANPQLGSRHNRGCAVDLTLVDLKTGEPVEMVSGYDEFTERAYPDYPGPSQRSRWHRELLRTEMEAAGFRVYEFEWWHFDYQDWQKYPILNQAFDEIKTPSP